jgi:RimJ/RimL family protein N-acetyltransferase
VTGFAVPAGGIRAGELALRLPELRDLDVVLAAFRDDAIAGPVDFPPMGDDELRDFADTGAQAFAESGQGLALMIEDGRGETLGGCSLWSPDWERSVTDLGYWLLPAARGRGAATIAARTLAAYAHDVGFHRVQAYVHVGNDASCRVLERADFTHEGILRSVHRRRGPRGDNHLFSHLPGE